MIGLLWNWWEDSTTADWARILLQKWGALRIPVKKKQKLKQAPGKEGKIWQVYWSCNTAGTSYGRTGSSEVANLERTIEENDTVIGEKLRVKEQKPWSGPIIKWELFSIGDLEESCFANCTFWSNVLLWGEEDFNSCSFDHRIFGRCLAHVRKVKSLIHLL